MASLKAIEVYVTGNPDMQLYDLRTVKMPALFEQCSSAKEIPNLIIKVNKLNHDIGTINPEKKFPSDDLRERLLNLLSRDQFGLKDVHRSAFLDSKLATWDGLCSHLGTVIRPEATPPPRSDRGTALAATHPGAVCLKCGASDSNYHPARRCSNAFKPCDTCDRSSDDAYTHSAKFHDKWLQLKQSRDRNPQTLTCWRCGGAHRSVGCNVPCKCDICGKDDHATAHHNLYQRFKGKRSGDANVCTKPAIEQLTL